MRCPGRRWFATWLVLLAALTSSAQAEEPPPSEPMASSADGEAPPAESGVERYRARTEQLETRIAESKRRLEQYLAEHPEARPQPGADSGVGRYQAAEAERRQRIDEAQREVHVHAYVHGLQGAGDVERYDPAARQDEIDQYLELRKKWEEHQALSARLGGGANPATHAPFHVGVDWHGAGRSASLGGGIVAVSGLTVAYALTSFFGVGVGQIAPSSAELPGGLRWSLGAAPYLEGFLFIAGLVQPYLQGGAALQWRWGGRERGDFGVAPYGALGARLWVGRHFAIGPAARVYTVVTDGFLMAPRVLPRGAVVFTGGLGIDLHL